MAEVDQVLLVVEVLLLAVGVEEVLPKVEEEGVPQTLQLGLI